jgi:hypothetical protein
MTQDLQVFKDMSLSNLTSHYQVMLKDVTNYFPVIEKATGNFNKSQSQFMNNMLTVSHNTVLRNARQILSEIERSKQALDEAYFKVLKDQNEIKRKELALTTTTDLLDKELLEIELAELNHKLKTSQGYIEGAIRKVSAYVAQYRQLLKSLGKDEFTEEDFERDEENYHIMKMFEQGLCAARSHYGVVDEGNQIYAHQIGLNGTVVQAEVTAYLQTEIAMIERGEMPSHGMTIDWLRSMAEKYAGSAVEYAARKGMMLLDTKSLHQEVIE